MCPVSYGKKTTKIQTEQKKYIKLQNEGNEVWRNLGGDA